MASRLAKALSNVGSHRKQQFTRRNGNRNRAGSEPPSLLEASTLLDKLSHTKGDAIEDPDVTMGHREVEQPETDVKDSFIGDVSGDICLITESPYRILKVSRGEWGNTEVLSIKWHNF